MKKLLDAIKNLKPIYRGDTIIITRREWETIEKIAEELEVLK